MALDNAQFIAELSITDPPGTDPLSQGDDQIRTIKRATQQSFPNIDKAVTLTADQMLQMAIKNEANVFTQTQQITPSLIIDDGGTATQSTTLQFTEAGQRRFRFLKNQAAVDSSFNFERYSPAGTFVDNVYTVDPTTGVMAFTEVPTVQGAPLWIAGEIRTFAAAVTPGTNWFIADGTNGTLNLADRWQVGAGAFAGAAGSNLNAEINGVTAAGVTGSTALTEAQMPAHNHSVYRSNNSAGGITDAPLNTADNVFGARRGDTTKIFSKTNGTRDLLGLAGSGSGHTHADGGNAFVITNPTFTDAVQPVSIALAYYQYVP